MTTIVATSRCGRPIVEDEREYTWFDRDGEHKSTAAHLVIDRGDLPPIEVTRHAGRFLSYFVSPYTPRHMFDAELTDGRREDMDTLLRDHGLDPSWAISVAIDGNPAPVVSGDVTHFYGFVRAVIDLTPEEPR